MRYRDDGSENPDFVLNKPAYKNVKISSPAAISAAAPRARALGAARLRIRCVISTDFADIFYNNCFKNGILPIKVAPEDLPDGDGRRRGA